MQTIIKYQAKDGKVFDNKNECEEYEFSLLTESFEDKIIFFDEDFSLLNGELVSNLRDCKYIYISPDLKDKADTANAIYHESGYIIPSKSGYWVYEYDDDSWISIDKRIEALLKWQEIRTKLEYRIEKEYRYKDKE